MSALLGTFDDTASFKPITRAKLTHIVSARVVANCGRQYLSSRVPLMEKRNEQTGAEEAKCPMAWCLHASAARA
jgi:hypothetical protein